MCQTGVDIFKYRPNFTTMHMVISTAGSKFLKSRLVVLNAKTSGLEKVGLQSSLVLF